MEDNHLGIIFCVQAVIKKQFFSKPVAIHGLITNSKSKHAKIIQKLVITFAKYGSLFSLLCQEAKVENRDDYSARPPPLYFP